MVRSARGGIRRRVADVGALALVGVLLAAACGGTADEAQRAKSTEESRAAEAAGRCPKAGARPPESGLIVPNRGAVGVELGMTAAEVVACLGRPRSRTPAHMDYARPAPIFDVFMEEARVRGLSIAGAGFCLPHHVCLDERRNVRELRRYFGEQVFVSEDEAGFRQYVMEGELRGRAVTTRLLPNGVGGAINQVEIEWRS